MIISLGPKKSGTKFFKKTLFFEGQKNLTYFSRIIECEKPQSTTCKGPTGDLTITVENLKILFVTPEWLFEDTNF